MKNGLKITLIAVVAAAMAAQAYAKAPTVTGFPNKVFVGDLEGGSASNNFVFPMSTALSGAATDEDGPENVIWSYTDSQALSTGTEMYRINDTDPIIPDGAAEVNPVNIIGGPGSPGTLDPADDPTDVTGHYTVEHANADGVADTITIRNVTLSPLTGTLPYADPTVGGVVGAVGEVDGSDITVTLFASDGTTAGSKDVDVVSVNDTADSTEGGDRVLLDSVDFTTEDPGWTFAQVLGTVTSQAPGTGVGMCLEVPAAGLNIGDWTGVYGGNGGVDLVANAVYEVRLTVSTTSSTAGTQPAWLLKWDNANPNFTGGTGPFVYGGVYYFLDNVGGANSAITGVGRSEFVAFLAPACVLADAWNNGIAPGVYAAYPGGLYSAFDPTHDADNDFRLQFQILDVDGVGYGAESDLGQVCWESLELARYDINDMVVNSTPYERTDFSDARTATPESAAADAGVTAKELFHDIGSPANNTNIGFGTTLSVDPGSGAAAGWTFLLFELQPGQNDTGLGGGDINTDAYPVAWETDKLLALSVEMSAPDASSMDNPADEYRLGLDAATNELIGISYFTGNLSVSGDATQDAPPIPAGPATPKENAEPFIHFLYTHTTSLSTGLTDGARIRPRMLVLSADVTTIGGKATNTHGFVVDSWKVDDVSF